MFLYQVSEILSKDKTRLSISGWFHGQTVERSAPYEEPPHNTVPPQTLEVLQLDYWTNRNVTMVFVPGFFSFHSNFLKSVWCCQLIQNNIFSQSVSQSVCLSVIQSASQSVNQSVNQSVSCTVLGEVKILHYVLFAFFIPLQDEVLVEWINPLYLDEETVTEIRQRFGEESEIQLESFLLVSHFNCKTYYTVNMFAVPPDLHDSL